MIQDLIESIQGGIAALTMNRCEARNVLSAQMLAGGAVKGFARRAGAKGSDTGFDHKVNERRARMAVGRWLPGFVAKRAPSLSGR